MDDNGTSRPDLPERSSDETATISSQELFRGARQLVIVHNAERYVLRITRQGKLILNK